MRGKGSRRGGSRIGHRITPAYAGKRCRCRRRSGHSRDHPRVCGEKASTATCSLGAMGSPPRMRGKGAVRLLETITPRITPAYAGKRLCRAEIAAGSQDHPRVCGEKYKWKALVTAHQGSPPRMRGKGQGKILCAAKRWITPAYAGKSRSLLHDRERSWDHPRVCGEKLWIVSSALRSLGSPPRMRGKVHGLAQN